MWKVIYHPNIEGWDRPGKRQLPRDIIQRAQLAIGMLRHSENPKFASGVKNVRWAYKKGVWSKELNRKYRLLFEVEGDTITILDVAHRSISFSPRSAIDQKRKR